MNIFILRYIKRVIESRMWEKNKRFFIIPIPQQLSSVIDSATTRNNVYTTNDRMSDGLNDRKMTEVEKEHLVRGCARPS